MLSKKGFIMLSFDSFASLKQFVFDSGMMQQSVVDRTRIEELKDKEEEIEDLRFDIKSLSDQIDSLSQSLAILYGKLSTQDKYKFLVCRFPNSKEKQIGFLRVAGGYCLSDAVKALKDLEYNYHINVIVPTCGDSKPGE